MHQYNAYLLRFQRTVVIENHFDDNRMLKQVAILYEVAIERELLLSVLDQNCHLVLVLFLWFVHQVTLRDDCILELESRYVFLTDNLAF